MTPEQIRAEYSQEVIKLALQLLEEGKDGSTTTTSKLHKA